jgi:hypothetical protein
MIEVNKCIGRPELSAQLLAGYHLTVAFQQYRKDLQRLAYEFEFDSILSKLAPASRPRKDRTA